jgi:hypothetical protein
VLLLIDIRGIFDRLRTDRICSGTLIGELLLLADAPWSDWKGPNDDRPARKLNQSELARLLRGFGIKPRSIWLMEPGDKSRKGYLRDQFVPVWAAYCTPAGRPAGMSKIKQLRPI